MNPDFSDYFKSIQENTSQSERREKVARLIVLLHKIDKELTTVQQTLIKLKFHAETKDSDILSEVEQKLKTVSRLQTKIRASRLNLNYHFI